MIDVIVQALLLLGSLFIFLAAVGVSRMPDIYLRMSTVTKGGTLGVGLLLLAVLIELFSTIVFIKVVAVIAFGFLTSPVAAHMISRAAYFQGVQLWEGSVIDELAGQYERAHHDLASPAPGSTVADIVLHHHEGGAEGTDAPR